MTRRVLYFALGVLLVATFAFPQAGRLEGVARDSQGLVLPGVTATLSGAAVMGQRVATTDVDGSYRFGALAPGTYTITFELAGFQTLRREGIIVTTGSTFNIDATLELATVAETITVTGESPIVDVKTTGIGANFDTQQLQDVPSATDMWAVLGQTPGVRMRGYDIGGSHKSQQVGYESFGVRMQSRVINEGVNTTEGAGWSGGYYDYYAIEEFRVSAQGSDVEMSSSGAQVVAVFKSGGNEFSSLTHYDFETSGMVNDNIDQALIDRKGSSAPVREFQEFHIDFGGPAVKDKFWFYGAYNYFKINKVISGQPENIATDIGLFDEITAKINWQMTERDQFIGFSHWSLKQKPFRGLSATIPAESIRAQNSWTWLHKAEWQRVWSDRLFSNILVGHFGFGWPMTPAVDPATNPARLDVTSGNERGAGWQPFNLGRWKPQSTGQFNYYVPQAAGSHDFKLGWDWQIDSYQFGANLNSGAIRYRDRSALGPCSPCAAGQLGAVDEIDFFNTPTANDDRNTHWDFYAQDTWSMNDRLTVTFGARFGRQDIHYLGSTQSPVLSDFFQPVDIEGKQVITWNTLAPRFGVTYDLTGRGKSVFKGYYGRYYANAASMSFRVNPGGNASKRYKFLDPNGNGLYDGTSEIGAFVTSTGGAGGTIVDPDMTAAYVDEFSFSVEHELRADTGVRFSYVRKHTRNNWFGHGTPSTINLARTTDLLTNNVTVPCTGCPGDFAGTSLNLRGLPNGAPVNNLQVTNSPGDTDGNYDTIQFAANRRFSQKFFVNANFDYQWRHEMRSPNGESQSPLDSDPIDVEWHPDYNRDISLLQDSQNWQARVAGRYEAPHEIGIAGTLRVQSGYPWAAIHRVSLPNVGTVPFFLENLDNNYSDMTGIVDLRVDKAFSFGGKYSFTAMADIYNLFNSNAETNFIMRTGATYDKIIEWLGGRTLKIGLRFQF